MEDTVKECREEKSVGDATRFFSGHVDGRVAAASAQRA